MYYNLTNKKQIVHLPGIVTRYFKVDIFKAEKPGSVGKSTLPGVEVGEESMTASGGSFIDSEVI